MKNIVEYFSLPYDTKATKKLKTYLIENLNLKTNDKKIIKNYTKSITLHNILSQSTINISKYEDEDIKYIEIYLIIIEVTSKDKIKQLSNIINSIFQKPLIIIFTHQNYTSINITPKRVNKADTTKLVSQDYYFSSWIDLNNPTTTELQFLNKLNIKNHPFTNFYDFYKSYEKLIISFNASKFSGKLTQKENNKEILAKIEKLVSSINNTIAKIKKEDNIREKVNLNIELKKLQNKLEEQKGKL